MATDNQVKFQGFQFPTTTPVPDEVFDVLMPQLSGAELKVLLYICRRTFGFKKESDTISLHQIAAGIKTRDGRVLDGGTGLCKRHVIRALKALEKKNIIKVTRKVDETGLNEVNTYSLNVLDAGGGIGTKSPYGSDKISPGVVTPESGGVVTPVSPTTNSNQETVIQETDIVVAAQDLENFGIAKAAATKLMQDYPAAYIREKVAMAQGLVAAGSCLVSQNPAGWLRCAIEEDYSPPRTSERHRQRHVREKKDATLVQTEPRKGNMPKVRSQQAQNVPTEQEQNVPTEPRENNTEKKEPEITSRENETTWETTWAKTLEKLQADLLPGEADARLKGTTLLQVTDTAARIGVPSAFVIAWLERRMYGQISKAMKEVLGKDLDLQFVAAT
jgi:Bacteriophage replication protein O